MASPLSAATADASLQDSGLRSGLSVVLSRPRLFLPALVVLVFCVMAAFPSWFAGWFGNSDPRSCVLARSGRPPASGHPFGFDIQGCDLYSNVVYGARASISVALLTTALTILIAVVLGSLAGYLGGVTDSVVGRLMDIFFGFPQLVGMIVILESLDLHSVVGIALVLALFTWPSLTRVMRASVMETAGLDYVAAARGLGAGPVRILVRHVGVNAVGPVAVLAGLNVGAIITAEAALSFLGVGLQPPVISWGGQLNDAQQYFVSDLHLLVFPSLFLSAAVLSFVLLGDALRDLIDPRVQ